MVHSKGVSRPLYGLIQETRHAVSAHGRDQFFHECRVDLAIPLQSDATQHHDDEIDAFYQTVDVGELGDRPMGDVEVRIMDRQFGRISHQSLGPVSLVQNQGNEVPACSAGGTEHQIRRLLNDSVTCLRLSVCKI